MTDRYFLRVASLPWGEVTREEWIQAERSCGFRPKGGGDGPATAGFSNMTVEGRVIYASQREHLTPESYAWDPDFNAVLFPDEERNPT